MQSYASRTAGAAMPLRVETVNGVPIELYASPHHVHDGSLWIATSALLDALRVPDVERYEFAQRHRMSGAAHCNIVLAPGRRVPTIAPPIAELAIYARERGGAITVAEAEALRIALGIKEAPHADPV